MKIALITTTINVPHVLELYRAHGSDVRFFVAGDMKTPHNEAHAVMHRCGDSVRYFLPEDQEALGYKSSKLFGWNCIQRRNIALLEAVKWGADIIVTVDDDNIPLDSAYFDRFEALLSGAFSGLKISGNDGWVSPYGALPHRGLPIGRGVANEVGFAVNVDVGVAAGICLGDPDISAITRIERNPIINEASEIHRAGFVASLDNFTVFNSQNTAFVRGLAPCMMMLPAVGRFDDIFASMICQRVMREHDLHVHFGQPFVYQQRNRHDLLKDLKAEMFGLEYVQEFAAWLDDFVFEPELPNKTPAQVRYIYEHLALLPWMPGIVREAGIAWCDDMESVL